MQIISAEQAMDFIEDGSTVMVGGFLTCGTPISLVDAMLAAQRRDLTIITNDTAYHDRGIGKLVTGKLVKKVIASHIGTNKSMQEQYLAGTIEAELVPQGTLAERIRAGGVGLGGVLTPTGVGTLVEEGKRVICIDAVNYLLETALKADVAIIKAKRADYNGNLQYSFLAQNFNPLMALAAATVIVEVDEIVPLGVMTPDQVHTMGALVDYVVVGGENAR